ncbi:unnamed protein product, partial [Scytosiphon promiscuus]
LSAVRPFERNTALRYPRRQRGERHDGGGRCVGRAPGHAGARTARVRGSCTGRVVLFHQLSTPQLQHRGRRGRLGAWTGLRFRLGFRVRGSGSRGRRRRSSSSSPTTNRSETSSGGAGNSNSSRCSRSRRSKS